VAAGSGGASKYFMGGPVNTQKNHYVILEGLNYLPQVNLFYLVSFENKTKIIILFSVSFPMSIAICKLEEPICELFIM
jgi:hypothetical protein